MLHWLGFALLLAVLLAALALLWKVWLAVAVAGTLLAVGWQLYGRYLRARFRAKWGPGKPILFVYSNSPHWQDYVETQWLPRVGPRAVVLNWSERSTWADNFPLESRLFRYYATNTEFNPLALYLPRRGRARAIRFWKAFRDFKHGRSQKLRDCEAQLFMILQEIEAATV